MKTRAYVHSSNVSARALENVDLIKGLKETTHGYKKNETKRMVSKFLELQYDVSIFSNRRQSDF